MEQNGMVGAQSTSSNIPSPASDEDIEEVSRRPVFHSVSYASPTRFERPPIRQRLHIEKGYTETYQMFEISATFDSRRSMDGSEVSSSSALTMATSATSSGTGPWSSPGFVEEEEDAADFDWDEEDGMLLVPKLEPMDEDMDMGKFSPLAPMKESVKPETPTCSTAPVLVKRPRGRPRKHPRPSLESQSKIAKGRSKTGCITCRKRKKKCDETKPGCLNCEKNSVTCEGYPTKTIWKSGKEKADEAQIRRASSISLSSIQLPFVLRGVETEGDRIFFHHYISRLSIILTLEQGNDSAFRNILLPMAQQHPGLMHSILALSSKHMDYTSPYGREILAKHPTVDVETLEKRSIFHQDAALKELVSQQCDQTVAPATYAQMMCYVLETLSDPKPQGHHRFHLQHYQKLIKENPPKEDEAMNFIHEFFQYHIHTDQLIYLPTTSDVHLISLDDDMNLPSSVLQPSAIRLLGVFDGLFLYMSKITNIRNKIRHNLHHRIDPAVDYKDLFAAAEIDAGIREWQPAWPTGDPRDAAGMLYRQMMWIYLYRTVYPPQKTSWKLDYRITNAVNDGLALLSSFGPHDPSQTLLLAPAFVIGCACFEVDQRQPIREAIGRVKHYMEYKNTDTALEVLEEVWRLMDLKDERSWDWQGIAAGMGMDFLAT